jgi:hypothetical protein
MSFKLLTFIFSRIKDLSTRYRENLQLVLKDITVNIEHGDKVMRTLEFEVVEIKFRLELSVELVVERAVCVQYSFVLSNRLLVQLSLIMLTFVLLVYMICDQRLQLFHK